MVVRFWVTVVAVFILGQTAAASEMNRLDPPNWLMVSDTEELRRTWQNATVFLPGHITRAADRRPVSVEELLEILSARPTTTTYPTILFLHACEGPGHHREDLRRYAKLGFIVIAPNSNARLHKRLGCHEEQEKFVRNFDFAAASKKAELAYAVTQLKHFAWIDRKNLFLIGSGIGGLVASHYQGDQFAGIVIEGWGCRGPNPIFDGIWAPSHVRVFSTISRNDPWYKKNQGFGIDCASFIHDREDSVSIVIDRPAHYVSWYPGSRRPLIRFLSRDLGAEVETLVSDSPDVIAHTPTGIKLRERWTDEAVYAAAKEHCANHHKGSHLVMPPENGVYSFVCE